MITERVTDQSSAGRSPLTKVSSILAVALQVWDHDRIEAKSQVEAAVAMLHSYSPVGSSNIMRRPAKRCLAPWQARKVREYIEAALPSAIRLKDCCDIARLSNSYFSHAFKATFVVTFSSYIQLRRIERAQLLMLQSKEPLSQIALACGFGDQAHYCRVFRRFVGSTPNAWRRQQMALSPGE